MSRVSVDWGTTPDAVAKVATDLRLAAYGTGQDDPSLEQTMFAYGRYLLLGSSRPGGLPANLQGLWNDSNQPPWAADYHTNINVQMNYWGAETANMSESHEPLMEFIRQVAVPSRVATRNAFGADTRGWTARTSQSIFGGNAWEWNTVASAWYGLHIYEHWAFNQDEVPSGDGTAHAQGNLPVLGGPACRGRERLAGLAQRLVTRARPARGWRHVRPADDLGPVPELHGLRGRGRGSRSARGGSSTAIWSGTCSNAWPPTRSASGGNCRNGRPTGTTPTASTATPHTCSLCSRGARST